MRRHVLILLPCSVLLAAFALGCQPSPTQLLKMDESQAELRAMQSRVFETADEHQMLRVVIGTLQDLGFVIREADHRLGLVSGTMEGWTRCSMPSSAARAMPSSLIR